MPHCSSQPLLGRAACPLFLLYSGRAGRRAGWRLWRDLWSQPWLSSRSLCSPAAEQGVSGGTSTSAPHFGGAFNARAPPWGGGRRTGELRWGSGDSRSAACLGAGAGAAGAGPCFAPSLGGPTAPAAASPAPSFLARRVRVCNPAASVRCEDAPCQGTSAAAVAPRAPGAVGSVLQSRTFTPRAAAGTPSAGTAALLLRHRASAGWVAPAALVWGRRRIPGLCFPKLNLGCEALPERGWPVASAGRARGGVRREVTGGCSLSQRDSARAAAGAKLRFLGVPRPRSSLGGEAVLSGTGTEPVWALSQGRGVPAASATPAA